MNLIFYDAIRNEIFQSVALERLFCALAIRGEWWSENPHVDIIGLL